MEVRLITAPPLPLWIRWALSWTGAALVVGLPSLLRPESWDPYFPPNGILLVVVMGIPAGLIQSRLLPSTLASNVRWARVTAVGTGLAFVTGFMAAIPIGFASIVLWPLFRAIGDPNSPVGVNAWTTTVASGGGYVSGLILGSLQARALKRSIPDVRRWAWTSAWAGALFVAAMFALFYVVPTIPRKASYVVGLVVGATLYGATTGVAMTRLLRERPRHPL